MAGPETSVWALGTQLPKSRVSGHTGMSFYQQTPWVSSQTGQDARSASADLTLKIGSRMPVRVAGCVAVAHPTDEHLLTRSGPSTPR